MITYTVTQDAVAVILDDSEHTPLKNLIENCLISYGLEPWPDIEAEQFTLCGESLVIARPRAPLSMRTGRSTPRLRRLG